LEEIGNVVSYFEKDFWVIHIDQPAAYNKINNCKKCNIPLTRILIPCIMLKKAHLPAIRILVSGNQQKGGIGMEEWDIYTRKEYKKMLDVFEKNMLLNPDKREKYLKGKAERERTEKIVKRREHRVRVMY